MAANDRLQKHKHFNLCYQSTLNVVLGLTYESEMDLEEALVALVLEPEEAEDAREMHFRGRSWQTLAPHALEDFIERGAKDVDACLQTVSQWIDHAKKYALSWERQLAEWNLALFFWLRSEMTREGSSSDPAKLCLRFPWQTCDPHRQVSDPVIRPRHADSCQLGHKAISRSGQKKKQRRRAIAKKKRTLLARSVS